MSLDVTHYPVMLNQLLSILTPQHGGTFIDCTFGGGGYSNAILSYPKTKVIAIDRDKNGSSLAEKIKKKFPKRFKFINDKIKAITKEQLINGRDPNNKTATSAKIATCPKGHILFPFLLPIRCLKNR